MVLEMRKALSLFVAVGVILAATACNTGTSGDSASSGNTSSAATTTPVMNVLPSKIIVDVPASMTANSSSSSSMRASAARSGIAAASLSSTYGCSTLRTTASGVESKVFDISVKLVLVDEAISGLSPSSGTHESVTSTVTQDMVTKMVSLSPSSWKSAFETTAKEWVGLSYTLPAFTFTEVSDGSSYSYCFQDVSSSSSGESVKILWSADKTKLKYVRQMGSVQADVLLYDSSANVTRCYCITTSNSYVETMKEVGDDANGIYVSAVNTDAVSCIVSSTEGFVDDNGGVVVQKQSIYNASNLAFTFLSAVEGFDATGAVTYQNVGGTVISGSEPTAYKEKYINGLTEIDGLKSDIADDDVTIDMPYDTLTDSNIVKNVGYCVFNSDVSAAVSAYNADNADSARSSLISANVATGLGAKTGLLYLFPITVLSYENSTTLYVYSVAIDESTSAQKLTLVNTLTK